MLKRRKVDCENRIFKPEWELDYLFIFNKDSKPQCLICVQVLAVLKEYNLKRHYATHHQNMYEKHSIEARKLLVEQLKTKLNQQQSMYTKGNKIKESSIIASYTVTYELAKSKKPFTDGNFVKKCAIQMAKAFSQEKIAKEFESVPLSKQTVARRTEDISLQLSQSLKSCIENCSYFSLAIDESTDITDTCQLLIFVKVIQEDFTVIEELLKVCSLHDTCRGTDIFSAVQSAVDEVGGFGKVSAVCTDGCKAFIGSNTGFVGLLKQNKINVPTLHCIIHQEALCAKSINLKDTMATVVKITNLIRGGHRSLNHRKFLSFLEEVDSSYGDLLLYTEIRWLSRGKCLIRFFELKNDIYDFLRENLPCSIDLQRALKDINFVHNLAYLTDITQHLNILNLQLQGEKQTIFQMMGYVDGFKKKLNLFRLSLQKNDLFHFSSCKQLLSEIESANFSKYAADIEHLICEFDRRFQDFEMFRPQTELFNNPIKCTVECQPSDLQLELCDLQCDPFLSTVKALGADFWKLLPNERYPCLRKWALKMCSIFGSTYLCETTFSSMKLIKSKTRNRMTDSTLSHTLRIATSKMEVDFKSLVESCDKPQSSH